MTNVQGVLQRMSADGTEWTIVRKGLTPRFFHRMLPLTDRQFVLVGGSNMSIGKYEEVEVIDVQEKLSVKTARR